MAAVVITPTGARAHRPPAPAPRPTVLDVVQRPSRPTSGRLAPSVYRRRRVVVLAAALALAIAAVLVTQMTLSSVLTWRAGSVATTPDSITAPAPPAGGEDVYVVRPGDSLWSIAQRIAPDADPRPIVDELARRAGGPSLRPGQRLPIDGIT